MNNQNSIQQRFFAAVAAAAVSTMCVLGTVGPVQAGGSVTQTQFVQTATQQVAA
jgi:putative effector of murein hydrolase LrgA (UPF0299 family)